MLPLDAVFLAVPFATGGGFGDDALRAAREAGDADPIIFYHGTQPKYLSSFRRGGKIEPVGDGDFGVGFYTTKREAEAIGWAGDRSKLNPGEKYVIAIEVEKVKFDTLVGKETNPWEYRFGVTPEEYHRGIRKTQAELDAFRASADYFYGPVNQLPDWEQFVFKRQHAFEVLNVSPRSIYKVSPQNQLELIERIIP